jgi:signal transduction histidine kinase
MVDHLQRVLDSFTDEIVVIDPDFRITYANSAWLRRADLVPAQIFGRPCYQILLGAGTPCSPEECAAQQVLRTRQPVRLRHQSCAPGAADHETPVAASPVIDPDGLVAEVVEVRTPSAAQTDQPPLTAGEDALAVAQRLAGQLAIGLENSRLVAQGQQRAQELTGLMRVSQAVNEARDLDTILNIVLEQALSLVGSQEGSIILVDPPRSDRLRIVAERGMRPEDVEALNNRPIHTHDGAYRRALSSGKIEVIDTSPAAGFLYGAGFEAQRATHIPLTTQRGPIGLIAVVGWPRDETVRHLLTILAGIATMAIDKERLYQETAARLAEVSTLYTLATQITSSLSLTSVLNSIVSILRMTLDCRACSIFLIDARGEFLQLEAASGPSVAWKGIARLRIGEGISGRAITEQRSIYVPDTHLEPDFIFFDPKIRSLVVVPLIVRNQAIGTLSIDATQPNAFDEEVRLLAIAAAEAAVAIENAELYESLQASYRELENAFDELRRLDDMKSELIQNVSHELRTPLTFIKGYVELLHAGQMGEMLDEQKAAIDIVASKTEVLCRLVDDIVTMLQADREQLGRTPISLADIGHATIQAAQASAADAGLDLIDEIPDALPPVLGDGRRLGQVFDNLLQNAIKFSNPGGTITVRMRDEGTRLRTEVQDRGIGIPANQLPRIFERFYQVDGSVTRRYGGTGLGLAIVKQIVEAHAGTVGVESKVNQGSLFFFTIPVAPTEHG